MMRTFVIGNGFLYCEFFDRILGRKNTAEKQS